MDLAIDRFDPQRFGLITGSKCSVLYPVKSSEKGQNTYAKELAKQKYFRFYDEVSTWQTDHGKFAEHEAFEYYQTHKSKTLQKGSFKRIEEWGGTSDAIDETYGVDFKCPTSLEGFLEYIHTGIDAQQYHQAQMYMFLFDRPLWKVCVYLTETFRMTEMGHTYPVDHKKRMIVIDVTKEIGWEEKLRERTPALIKLRDQYYGVLENQFGKAEPIPSPEDIVEVPKFLPSVDYTEKINQGKILKQRAGL